MKALVKQSSIVLLLLFKENVQREKSDITKFGIFLKLRLAVLLVVIWCAEKEHRLCIGLTVYCVRDQKIKCQSVFLMQFSRFLTYRVWIDSNTWVSTFLNVWQLEIRTRIFQNVPDSCDFLMLSTVIQRNKELKRVISAALIGHVTGPALR